MKLDIETLTRLLNTANVVGIVLTTLIFYLGYYTLRPLPIPGIPYNEDAAARVFGDLKSVKAAQYRRQWIWSQPREHGTVISQLFLFPFRRPTVIVSDYREAVDICSRRVRDFDRGTRNKECVGITAPNFHFTLESRDPRFRHHRELVRDLMTPWFLETVCFVDTLWAETGITTRDANNIVKVATPRVYENAAALVRLWGVKELKARGRAFPANHDLYLSTLDTMCAVAFGMGQESSAVGQQTRHMEEFEPTQHWAVGEPVRFPTVPTDAHLESILDIPEMVAIAQRSPFPALSQRLALLSPRHARAHWNRRRMIRKQTEQALGRISSLGETYTPKSALDHLLHREKMASFRAGREPDFFSPVIRDEVLGYLLGGHDSTATVLSWWTKHMQCFQNVQSRLRQALRHAYPKAVEEARWPTSEEISGTSVPYLDAVVEESLRVASVATLISRTATCDTHILGHSIPRGTDVLLSLTGPSLTEPAVPVAESRRTAACQQAKDGMPAWGEDIGEYKPERWLRVERQDGREDVHVFNPHAGPSLAFSTGPRQCFGKKLALLQLKTTMALLLWNFELKEVHESLSGWDITERLVNLPKSCYVSLARTGHEEGRSN
ncbi:cytochrome P450 monooxygenase [Metarhizium album ARSEF 1941]|uniref:Cytochrome P450 monooxygenase n=1 Tax=Metarhizium album (strain ARSEF 1941) TaxID=1081103 RepID=A0A0B2WU85_METAS|nr:cytochrome P450 monooxygenase [Metarhizium album ARSEF 1941]KHN97204.1 cytochrome P450 monooxygenase [Metarhizium album ARSEF 1941]